MTFGGYFPGHFIRAAPSPARALASLLARLAVPTDEIQNSQEQHPTACSTRSVFVHSGSHAASRPGARSPTKATAPCACSPAQMRRSASAFGLRRRRPTRTRVHAKAELRPIGNDGRSADDTPRLEIGEKRASGPSAALALLSSRQASVRFTVMPRIGFRLAPYSSRRCCRPLSDQFARA